jgi:DNA repair protein RecO (recombination protein O)
MEKRRVANEPAFLLHRRPYTESSVLIDLFSRHHGRMVLIAKGARKLKSRWRGSLLPFQSLIAAWSGRGEVKTVTGIEGVGPSCVLRGKALYCGYYMNELVLRLLHRFDPHEDVFDNYANALARLSTEEDQERVLRIFEKQLLRDLGYGMHLVRDADRGNPIDPGERYRYRPDAGPLQYSETDHHGVPVHGATLLALEEEVEFDERTRRESKRLIRSVLDYHLDGQTLRTRIVYGQMFPPESGRNRLTGNE